jgi:hypothetical protein
VIISVQSHAFITDAASEMSGSLHVDVSVGIVWVLIICQQALSPCYSYVVQW